MPSVFISYRRSDTGGEAGRLSDSLKRMLGGALVFRDVVDISPGENFDVVLKKKLASAKLVLVLIGPAWLKELEQRLNHTGIDYLRLEVATALKKGKRVIPVMMKGAELPPVDALPKDLVSLTKCQAITIRDESWRQDLERLIGTIGHPYRWDLLALRVVVAVLAIVISVWALTPQLASDRVSDYNFLRWLVASLVGIYLIIEVSIGYLYYRKLKRS